MAAEVPEAVSLELGEWVSLFPVVLDGGRLLRRDPVLNRLMWGPESVPGCPPGHLISLLCLKVATQFCSLLVEGAGSILNPAKARVSGLPVFPLNPAAGLSILF